MNTYGIWLLGPVVLGAVACSSINYVPIKTYDHTAKAVGEVDLIPKGEKPPCDSETIGQATAANSDLEAGAQSAMTLIREKAASLGADGVKEFECGAPGTTGAHKCTGFVYVCKANPLPAGAEGVASR